MRPLKWLYKQPTILLFLATLCWGGNAVAGKLAVGHISPFLLTSLRWALATLIVLPIAYKVLRSDWALVRERLVFLFLLGTVGFSVFNNLMYSALLTTTAMNAAIIQAALPASIFVLNFLIFRDRASKFQLLGFPITVVGVLAVVSHGQWQVLSQLKFVIGDLLMLLAISFYGAYSVMLKTKPALHWLSLISVLSVSALLSSIPFVIFESVNEQLIVPDKTGYLVVIYTAVFASLLAQTFWIRGVELIGSNASSLFINLVPLLGTALAIVLLGEIFHWYHLVGIVFIISGIALAQRDAAKSSH